MKDNIELLNYSQDAIKDLQETEKGMMRTYPLSAHVLRQVTALISDSTKFILPNCADFIDPESFNQNHLDLARLPYPVVIFEIPWKKNHPAMQYRDFPVALSTKRIALCIDYSPEQQHLCPVPGLELLFDSFPNGGVLVFSIYYADNDHRWIMSQGGSFVPYDNKVESIKKSSITMLPASSIATEQLRDAGQVNSKNTKQFRTEPFIALPEVASQMQSVLGSRDKLFADIILNTRDEVFAYIGACSLLNCANVIIDKVQTQTPSAKGLPPSARKKIKPQPKARFEYKVLQISDERISHSRAETTETGAASVNPRRTHLRRGHIRRLKERLIWVRPSVINPAGTSGVIAKDYKLNTKL